MAKFRVFRHRRSVPAIEEGRYNFVDTKCGTHNLIETDSEKLAKYLLGKGARLLKPGEPVPVRLVRD